MRPTLQYHKWAGEISALEAELLQYGNMGEAAKAEPDKMKELLIRIAAMGGHVDPKLAKMVGISDVKKAARRFVRRADREN